MNGPTGLEHGLAYQLLDRAGYTGPDWWQALDDLLTLETAALNKIRGKP